MKKKNLTQDYLKECLIYDPIKGTFIWKIRPQSHFKSTDKMNSSMICNIWNSHYANKFAGNTNTNKNKYTNISIDKKSYPSHRLAFLYMEGYNPEYEIDHIDRNKSNNKWSNLRHVTPTCNTQNKNIYKSNKTGVNGVSFISNENRWRVRITIHKKQVHLGYYTNFIDAVKARYEEEKNNPMWSCSTNTTAYLYLKENNLL